MTEVFAIKLIEEDDFQKTKEELFNLLPQSNRKSILRYKKVKDLQRSLLGEALSRKLLSEKLNISSHKINILKSAKGKPYIPNKNIHYNLSHSGEWVVISFSNSEIGIDLEKIREIDFKIAKRFFSKEEFADLDRLNGRAKTEYFFDLWTLKESYLKLLGKGLTKALSSFTVIKKHEDFKLKSEQHVFEEVYFKQYLIDDKHKLSVCSYNNTFPEEISFISIESLVSKN